LLEKNPLFENLTYYSEDSSTLIARGAAKLASVEMNVEEKTRFEIGTRVVKGAQLDLFEPFIKVGEKLPCSGKHRFYLTREGQENVIIEYYEKDAKNYPHASRIDDDGINLVNQFTVSGIPDQKDLSVMVTFTIETDGTPVITAEILDKDGKTVKTDGLTINRGGNLY
jgi:molecular chaperone DnaK (HSP70)